MKKIFICLFGMVALCGMALTDAPELLAEDEFTLEEVTVTAQKREQNLQKVPMAIDTISGYELTEMGKVDLEDALASLPSVIVQRMGNRLNVSIRGVDNDYSPDVSNSMVAVTYDGIYSSVAGIDASGLYDSSRIEVLNGPQGTLYSRASTGGVVNIVSNNPVNEFEASGTVEVGNYNLLNTQGMVNVPVNDNLYFRTAFASQFRDGYMNNGTNDNDTKSARVKIKYDPNEDLSVILAVDLVRMGGKGEGENSPFAVAATMFEDDQPDDPWVSTMDGKDFSVDREIAKYYAEVNWDLGFGDLTLLPAVTKMDQELYTGVLYAPFGSDETPVETFTRAIGWQDEVSAEARISSPEDSFIEWLGGVYYYTRDYRYISYEHDGSVNTRKYENPSLAVFANMTYPIADSFRLNLGGRWTRDEQDAITLTEPTPPWLPPDMLLPIIRDTKFFDYKIGIEYDLTDQSMLWADFSTGHRAGQRDWPDETLYAYQLGVKNRFLDNRLQANLSSYYYSYKDFQVQAPTRQYTYTVDGEEYTTMDRGDGSGGEATIAGFELATSYILTQRDRIDFTAAYQYSDVSELTFTYDFNPPVDVSGGRLNNSPEFTLYGSYERSFPMPNGGEISARIDSRYRTETTVMMNAIYNADILRIPEGMSVEKVNTEPAHHISNASIKYSDPGGKWTLNAYVKNIENYAEKKNLLNNALRLGPPRTYGLVLSVKY
jgi:iron complex outermembrane receptor protein